MPDDDPLAAERMRDRLSILQAMTTVIERRQELMDVMGLAADADAARREIMNHFNFSAVQAIAVLDLQVRRFTDDARHRISEETAWLHRQQAQ